MRDQLRLRSGARPAACVALTDPQQARFGRYAGTPPHPHEQRGDDDDNDRDGQQRLFTALHHAFLEWIVVVEVKACARR